MQDTSVQLKKIKLFLFVYVLISENETPAFDMCGVEVNADTI